MVIKITNQYLHYLLKHIKINISLTLITLINKIAEILAIEINS